MKFTTTSFQVSNPLDSKWMTKIADFNQSLRDLEIMYPAQFLAHLATCHKAFNNSLVKVKKPQKALILGSGNCSDIPLWELVSKFSDGEINFLDFDSVATPLFLNQLKTNKKRKVNFLVEDMCGINSEIFDKIEETS